MHLEIMQRERLFQALPQAGGGTRIQLMELIMQPVQRLPGIAGIGLGVGQPQLVLEPMLMGVRQVGENVADLVHLAALKERSLARRLRNGSASGATPVQQIQPRLAEIESALEPMA